MPMLPGHCTRRDTARALRGAWQSTDVQEGPLAAGMKPPRFLTPWSILGAIVWLVLIAQFVWAADHRNLEEGIPTAIEDAYTIAFRSFEQQTRLTYEDDGERGDIFRLEQRQVGMSAGRVRGATGYTPAKPST